MKNQKINDEMYEFKAEGLTRKELIIFLSARIEEIQDKTTNHFQITVHGKDELFDINGYITMNI